MVDPQKDLGKPVEDSVVKHLDGILAKDSPLMDRAQTRGFQIANSRGLLNSSIAAGAAMGEMIDRATPIAQQEAQQGFGQNQQRREFEEGGRVRGFQAGEAAKERDFTSSESQKTRDFSTTEAQRDREQQTQIANMNLDASERQNLSTTLSQMESLYASQYAAIMGNTELSSEQRTAQLTSLEATRRQRVDLAQQVYDVRITLPSAKKVTRQADRQDAPAPNAVEAARQAARRAAKAAGKSPAEVRAAVQAVTPGAKPQQNRPRPSQPAPRSGFNVNLDR